MQLPKKIIMSATKAEDRDHGFDLTATGYSAHGLTDRGTPTRAVWDDRTLYVGRRTAREFLNLGEALSVLWQRAGEDDDFLYPLGQREPGAWTLPHFPEVLISPYGFVYRLGEEGYVAEVADAAEETPEVPAWHLPLDGGSLLVSERTAREFYDWAQGYSVLLERAETEDEALSD